MYKKKRFLGIIPARGGSKRLPRKNILDMAGKPLIAWTIEAALESKYIDEVMVTTDNKEIAQISKKYGADIPFLRPEDLSGDMANSFDVVQHVIEHYQEILKNEFDFIVLLQPTSPLRSSWHIDEAIEQLVTQKADAIISVCEVEHSPLWSNTLPENDDMRHFIRDEIKNTRSQDLPQYYRINGAIYICQTEKLLKEKVFLLKDNVFAFKMDKIDSVDIDEELDFIFAETILSHQANKK